MVKKFLSIAAIVAILGLAGYFSYQYVFLKEDVNIFSLVPNHALLVYESHDIGKDWANLQEKPLWENLREIPTFKNIGKDIALLDSLTSKNESLSTLLEGKPFLASMHVISKDEFDFLYMIKLDQISDLSTAKNILDKLKEKQKLEDQKRHFNGFDIYELRKKGSGQVFTYMIYKNFFLGSFAPILIEDVIRNINKDFANGFLALHDKTNNISEADESIGKLYINLEQAPDYFSLFTKEGTKAKNIINHFGTITSLEVNLKGDNLLLNGFTEVGQGTGNWLATFRGQKSQPFGFADLLPDRTAILHQMTFDVAVSWLASLKQFWQATKPGQLTQWDDLTAAYGVSRHDIFEIIGKEIGFAILASIEIDNPDQLLYIQCKEIDNGLETLDNLARQVSAAAGDTVYSEEYAGVKIRQLNLKDFPAKVFGTLFSGFESCYYMPVGEYIIIGNSVQILKSVLNDIEQEATWGKSVKYNEFLANTIKESNYDIMINMPKAWPMLTDALNAKWKKFARKNSQHLKRVELIGVQFSNIEDDFYTSVTLRQGTPVLAKGSRSRLMNVHHVYLENPIISKPFIVKNHINGDREVVLQDSAKIVYLISSEGRILWRDSLDSPIRSEVYQIDYFDNGKLQYLFATNKGIYIVDRDGKAVADYPLFPDYSVDQLAVIDYDNSKRYRFLVSDKDGNIYMYNKQGENLEGWQPRELDYRLSTPPGHIRVRGKDCIYAVQENGVINIMTRRGEMYPGFPLEFNDKIKSPLFIEIGSSFSQTYFTTVTENGMLLQFNLEGKVLKQEQLYRPSATTNFRIIPGALGKSFVILRQDMRRVAILSSKGEILFEKDYLSSEAVKAQYYYFGVESALVAITDQVQDFTYLYDLSGNLINGQPMESGHEIGLLYYESTGNFRLYSTYERKFSLETF